MRLGWFETVPAGLPTATARAGRTDLLAVPPQASEPAARAALDRAAMAGNRTRAPALLAATTTAAPGTPPAGPPGPPADGNRTTGQHPAEQPGTGGRQQAVRSHTGRGPLRELVIAC